MHLSNERMLVILAVGALAGWLIGKVLRGNGFGLVGDAAIGIVGALVGDWLLPHFNFHTTGPEVVRTFLEQVKG